MPDGPIRCSAVRRKHVQVQWLRIRSPGQSTTYTSLATRKLRLQTTVSVERLGSAVQDNTSLRQQQHHETTGPALISTRKPTLRACTLVMNIAINPDPNLDSFI